MWAGFCVNVSLHFTGINYQEYSCNAIWYVHIKFNKQTNSIKLFLEGLNITFPTGRYEWYSFCTSSTAIRIAIIFYFCHPDRYKVLSHCGSNSHFPNGEWCRTFFPCEFSICLSYSVRYLSFAYFQIELFFHYWVLRLLYIF